jgi:hypothetical protein
MPRRQPNATTKIACLLIENHHLRGEPIADWETLKAMTPDQVCSLFAWHHVTYHEWCGHNHPTVLQPLYIVANRERTAKIDIPTLAKVRRSLRKRQNAAQESRPRRKMLSRPFPPPRKSARRYGPNTARRDDRCHHCRYADDRHHCCRCDNNVAGMEPPPLPGGPMDLAPS